MISIEIKNIKDFMNKLLKQDTFNRFEIHSVEISHQYNVSIDGLLNLDSLDEVSRIKLREQAYATWADIQENVYGFLKGNKALSSLKITFLLSKPSANTLIERADTTVSSSDISGFILNIIYENNSLKLITATNYKSFTLDKSIEQYYDQSIIKFLNKNELE